MGKGGEGVNTGVPSHLMPMSMRLFGILGQYAEDHCYLFFKYDYIMLKVRLHAEANKVVKVQSLSQPLTADSLTRQSYFCVWD